MTAMHPDPVDQARRLVRERFPDAASAVLGGSVAAGRATPASDLDIAVLTRDGESYRETLRFEGRPAELFVHTPDSLAELFAVDVASRRALLQHVYAEGLVLTDPDGRAAQARARAAGDLLAGPPALGREAVESRRYTLTDLLTDLSDTRDRVERLAVAGAVLGAAADLLCDSRRAWTGTGKWLPRRLLAADPTVGGALLEGHRRLCEADDPALLTAAAGQVLDLAGGPLSEGYRRAWRGTAPSHPATG
jgi:predicted nucleotidyltransferase